MQIRDECPRCRTARLSTWGELNDEEREIVKRLAAAAEYALEERQGRHRWCTRCWFEDTGHAPQSV